jgi:hypothetical protein
MLIPNWAEHFSLMLQLFIAFYLLSYFILTVTEFVKHNVKILYIIISEQVYKFILI